MTEVIQFLQKWGTLLVAAAALAQPWLIALWRKYLNKGRIEIHPAKRAELTFAGTGPTLAISLSVRALSKPAFLTGIELTLRRLKDKSEHKYDWGVFRSSKLHAGVVNVFTPEVSVEVPHALNIETGASLHQEIVFFDADLQPIIYQKLIDIQSLYQSQVYENYANMLRETLFGDSAADLSKSLEPDEDFVNEFFGRTEVVQTHSDLDRLNYWIPGDYEVEICVSTSEEKSKYIGKWRFTLSEADCNKLRSNAVSALQEACGRRGYYSFAYVDLVAVTES
jgi:hypothetical protein